MAAPSLRWEFVSVREVGQPVAWKWRVYTVGGTEVMRCPGGFESLAECIEDARKFGYQETGGTPE
jgi:hypothetical protein